MQEKIKDDTISRLEAISALCQYKIIDHSVVRRVLMSLPTAQPERKTGRWTIKNGELAFWDVCSECKKMVMHKAPFYNYCPNCGADMRGEQDLPPAQPELQWIPCSERLPDDGEVVLTQANFRYHAKMAVSSRVDYNYWTGWGTRDINVVAWQPLPEPYKEDKDGN